MEEWREIDGYPGYQISNDGRVRSYVNNRHGVGASAHELRPTPNHQGYNTVQLGRGNRYLVHRLVASAFIPNEDNYPLVRHLDDNPLNNRVENLAWGTQTDNMQDCVRHGRLVGDTSAARAANRKKIIATSVDGTVTKRFNSMRAAAIELGVWPQHITNVVKGKISQTGGWRFKCAEEDENV